MIFLHNHLFPDSTHLLVPTAIGLHLLLFSMLGHLPESPFFAFIFFFIHLSLLPALSLFFIKRAYPHAHPPFRSNDHRTPLHLTFPIRRLTFHHTVPIVIATFSGPMCLWSFYFHRCDVRRVPPGSTSAFQRYMLYFSFTPRCVLTKENLIHSDFKSYRPLL